MEHASFQRRRFPGETQVLHHKQNCFPMFQEFLTADHSQWNMIKKKKKSKKCTCKTVAFRAALEVFKLQVLSTRFSELCYAVSTRSNGFTSFCVWPFFRGKNTSRDSWRSPHWRRNMSTQNFTEGCVRDSTKKIPASWDLYLQSTIASFHDFVYQVKSL